MERPVTEMANADDRMIVGRVLAALDSSPTRWAGIRKNGRLLLALPADREAARRTLALYQPQRLPARILVALVRGVVSAGFSRLLPGACSGHPRETPLLSGVDSGTVGLLLGSPEHRVRRAIASYRQSGRWEVAKIGFGEEGREALEREGEVLSRLSGFHPGVPEPLGRIWAGGMFFLRLPRIEGLLLRPGEWEDAVGVLEGWVRSEPPAPVGSFAEWQVIQAGLERAGGRQLTGLLEKLTLQPVVRHGDFARWNLIRGHDGSLVVLDWEWGAVRGMPGIDIAHFFAQEARLVARQAPGEVVETTLAALRRERCADYLRSVGWGRDVEGALLASLAYTHGAGQQANLEVLEALVRRMIEEKAGR